MLIDHLVDLGHEADGFVEGDDDAVVRSTLIPSTILTSFSLNPIQLIHQTVALTLKYQFKEPHSPRS
jgi:hypothetical protein